MSKNSKIDTIIGVCAVSFLCCMLLWYFAGFGMILGVFKWVLSTIFGAIISSVITTVLIAAGALIVLVLGKQYLKNKTGSDSL
jgi:uncharacterized membrane protein